MRTINKFRLLQPGMRVQLDLIEEDGNQYKADVFHSEADSTERLVRRANFTANSNHHAKRWMINWLDQYFPKQEEADNDNSKQVQEAEAI